MKNKTLLYLVFLPGLLFTLLNYCKKDAVAPSDAPSDAPTFTYGTMSDNDGNVYRTIPIGTQVWMADNLKTTKYRNGDPIPNVTDNTDWAALTTGAYCWYNNDATTYKADYGALYNWYAVADGRNIAPVGWHVPTLSDWNLLKSYLGGRDVAGGPLKETGESHWHTPNRYATNSTGFTALPGGRRNFDQHFFIGVGGYGYWWSCTIACPSTGACPPTWAWSGLSISSGTSDAEYYDIFNRKEGLSVRCLRD